MNEEKKIMHYSNRQSILLVGEGDFSFAKCLAKAFGSATNLVATSRDSEVELSSKYSNAMANVREIKERGGSVILEVDALTMNNHSNLYFRLFDIIVYNFPHSIIGSNFSERCPSQIEIHRKLVKGFFKSARRMLGSKGEVHVTHKIMYPFSQWNIEELADEEGLILVEKVDFSLDDYPGYENKRGGGFWCDATFPANGSMTFKFTQKRRFK